MVAFTVSGASKDARLNFFELKGFAEAPCENPLTFILEASFFNAFKFVFLSIL